MKRTGAAGLWIINADIQQLENAIRRGSNARDAMPEGGKLTIETATPIWMKLTAGRIPEIEPGQYVMIAVADTGTATPRRCEPGIRSIFHHQAFGERNRPRA